jgi:TRAP-type C4-dicarboxylate transport system permease large subunit
MGHLRGGLAHVNILSSILFAGLSGSAVADTSALGSMLIPAMEKQGYTRRFAAAVTAASSVIGPIIPPSGIMIIYAYVMGESVAALFLAGIVPGHPGGPRADADGPLHGRPLRPAQGRAIVQKGATISPVEHWVSFVLLRLNIAGLMWLIAARFRAPRAWACRSSASFSSSPISCCWPGASRVSHDFRIVCKKAVAPLQTPIIILGGILIGVFTPTEAAAIAVAYALSSASSCCAR